MSAKLSRSGKAAKCSEKTHLDLQDVVAANALVVHLVVSIIGIATILILDKCEANGGYS
jgi:hypothetical protein